jgi:hypothetical protein
MLKASAAAVTGVLKLFADWSRMKIAEVFSRENKLYVGRLLGDISAEL